MVKLTPRGSALSQTSEHCGPTHGTYTLHYQCNPFGMGGKLVIIYKSIDLRQPRGLCPIYPNQRGIIYIRRYQDLQVQTYKHTMSMLHIEADASTVKFFKDNKCMCALLLKYATTLANTNMPITTPTCAQLLDAECHEHILLLLRQMPRRIAEETRPRARRVSRQVLPQR